MKSFLKGPHRYVVVLYEQSSKVEATAPNERKKFKLEKFAKDNNLGDPLAGNFFYKMTGKSSTFIPRIKKSKKRE